MRVFLAIATRTSYKLTCSQHKYKHLYGKYSERSPKLDFYTSLEVEIISG
ncbi:hypothetical protein [Aliterella atlantica]|nr:hypothetical protein [Aliterella atlantica]